MERLRQGYRLARIAIVCDDSEGYSVITTMKADGVPDELVVADRLTWDEMVGCVARATIPVGEKGTIPFSKTVPREAARALKETGRA
jgi:hypothetical protein